MRLSDSDVVGLQVNTFLYINAFLKARNVSPRVYLGRDVPI